MRIRLSQPPAWDWLAGAWAELGNILLEKTLLKDKLFQNTLPKKSIFAEYFVTLLQNAMFWNTLQLYSLLQIDLYRIIIT